MVFQIALASIELRACTCFGTIPLSGSKATLVVSLEFALIEDLDLELSGIADGTTEG